MSAPDAYLRLATIPDPNMALGVAARLMMSHPAFAKQPFGEWVAVLDGQARRGHQVFVLDETSKAVGLFGYALASEEVATGWLNGTHSPTHEECLAGDCIIFNAWISQDKEILRFMWDAFRILAQGKKAAFYKRYYDDGSVRPVRLAITNAVDGHIQRGQLATRDVLISNQPMSPEGG
jgi:hemolysin-activating ACP:hemolysin acyltransferase